jgi:tRNA pseudouridine38-40 synthase
VKEIFLGMRLALKIAYDGRRFHGHQRQPDRRTVEGECLGALRAAKIIRDPQESFFRSASRTDRGVSAIGNVVAFNSQLRPDAVVGAFNDKARDVWAWAHAEVPATFHPRHAQERWYRYHLDNNVSVESLREAAALFPGQHDFRSFTSDPPIGPMTIDRVEISAAEDAIMIDVRAPSFRRGMVRRVVAAMLAHAQGDARLADIRAALTGGRHDFGSVPSEPLFLMDVAYGFPFRVARKPKAVDEWRALRLEATLRLRWLRSLEDAISSPSVP